jgi:hypothetical protein
VTYVTKSHSSDEEGGWTTGGEQGVGRDAGGACAEGERETGDGRDQRPARFVIIELRDRKDTGGAR